MASGFRDRVAFWFERRWRAGGNRLLEVCLFADAGNSYTGFPMLRNRINSHVFVK
ncbi:hypothetical protein JVX93_15950 [Mycolicibacterium boenickei]|nr:hypothetical protein JVX93_15950 [Mycolicibacterium boenickei]